MKDYFLDIIELLTINDIDSYIKLSIKESKFIRYTLTQLITNVVELNKLLDRGILPKYIVDTRNIASHAYDKLDFKFVWK